MSRRRWRSGHTRGESGRELRRRLAARDGSRCFYCWTPYDDPTEATLDHYVPLCMWRTSKPWNFVLACRPCNEAKADRLPWPLVWLLLSGARPAAVQCAA